MNFQKIENSCGARSNHANKLRYYFCLGLSSKILARPGRYVNRNTIFAGVQSPLFIITYTLVGRGLRYFKKKPALPKHDNCQPQNKKVKMIKVKIIKRR